MSSMDGLRRQLAAVEEGLRDVVGRLDVIEGRVVTAQTKSLAAITPTEVKPVTTTTPSSRKA